MSSTASTPLGGFRFLPTASYALGLLLFFLPFVEFKCKADKDSQGLMELMGEKTMAMPVIKMTGMDMVTGKIKKDASTLTAPGTVVTTKDEQTVNSVGFAVAAFVLGIAGLILSLLSFRQKALASMVTALLAAVSLVILRFDFGSYIGKQMGGQNFIDLGDAFTIEFTVWFYLAILAFLTAAFFSYRQGLAQPAAYAHEAPPANAPQLRIENPGDQSEFPKSPSESDIG